MYKIKNMKKKFYIINDKGEFFQGLDYDNRSFPIFTNEGVEYGVQFDSYDDAEHRITEIFEDICLNGNYMYLRIVDYFVLFNYN